MANHGTFECNMNALFQSLEALEGNQLIDALLYLQRQLHAKFGHISLEYINNASFFSENKLLDCNGPDLRRVHMITKNCLCDKTVLESCPVHCSVIALDAVSGKSILQDQHESNYCQTPYLDLSQRDRITIELDKDTYLEESIKKLSSDDSEGILNLCAKARENSHEVKKIVSKDEMVTTDNFLYDCIGRTLNTKNSCNELDLNNGITLNAPVNAYISVERNSKDSPSKRSIDMNSEVDQLKEQFNSHNVVINHSKKHVTQTKDTIVNTVVLNIPISDDTKNYSHSLSTFQKTDTRPTLPLESLEYNVAKYEGALNLVNKKFKNELSKSESAISNRDIYNDIYPKVTQQSVYTEELTKDVADLSPISCRKCRMVVPDQSEWISHQTKCGAKFYCNHCNINFNTKAKHHKHLLCHQRNSCKKCPRTFRSLKLLESHMKKVHNTKRPDLYKSYLCEFCCCLLKKRSSLFHHLKIHALPNQKVCQKCGQFIEGELNYNKHIEEHISNAHLKCTLCDATFRRQQQYDDHMKGHRNNGCQYCEKSFSSKKSLYAHCKSEHPAMPQTVTINKAHKCDKCSKSFIRPSLLKDHKFTHTETNPFTCQVCNIRFSQRSSLKKHQKTTLHKHTLLAIKHSDSTNSRDTPTCELCGIIYPTQYLLQKHSLQVHDTRPTLKCLYCDYRTKRKLFLKRHTDAHLGLEKRKFMCEVCGSSFVSLSTLKDHMRFLHSDERHYKCPICCKSFKNNSCLLRHRRSHSDERPFKCDCGASYKQLPHLIRHLSSAHGKTVKTRRIKRLAKEEIEVVNNPVVTPEEIEAAEKQQTNDFILTSSEGVLLADDGCTSYTTPLFTVVSSQLIQLIPCSLQLGQEGLNGGELHSLSLANIGTEAPFSTASCDDALMIDTTPSLALESISDDATSDIKPSIDRIEINIANVSSPKIDAMKESLLIPGIVGEGALPFAAATLFHNSEAVSSDLSQDDIQIF